MRYMCYMGLTRQAAKPPLSPSSLLYVLYMLYYSDILYVLYNAYLVHVGNAMCIVHRLLYHIAHIAHIARTREEWMFSGLPCKTHIAHIARIARIRGRVDVSVACLVRAISTYSTYSKDAGDYEGSAGWHSVRAAFCMVFA